MFSAVSVGLPMGGGLMWAYIDLRSASLHPGFGHHMFKLVHYIIVGKQPVGIGLK